MLLEGAMFVVICDSSKRELIGAPVMCQGWCQDLGPDSGHVPASVDFTLGADDKQANTKQGNIGLS